MGFFFDLGDGVDLVLMFLGSSLDRRVDGSGGVGVFGSKYSSW